MNLNSAHLVLSQLASISTYLGGFSLVFLGAIITMAGNHLRSAKVTIIASAMASCCFVLSAVGWGILQLHTVGNLEGIAEEKVIAAVFGDRHKLFSILYLVGQFSLFACIGASGFLNSQRVGYVTSLVGLFGFFTMGYVLFPYVTVG